jgi:hypothetical protein
VVRYCKVFVDYNTRGNTPVSMRLNFEQHKKKYDLKKDIKEEFLLQRF